MVLAPEAAEEEEEEAAAKEQLRQGSQQDLCHLTVDREQVTVAHLWVTLAQNWAIVVHGMMALAQILSLLRGAHELSNSPHQMRKKHSVHLFLPLQLVV